MYKSILASALITLSASSAFALDFSSLNHAIATSNNNPWNRIADQISYDLKYVSQYFKHRRNGATDYNAATYSAFDASKHIGYDGTGINVLVKDSHGNTGRSRQTHPTCLLYTSPSPRD